MTPHPHHTVNFSYKWYTPVDYFGSKVHSFLKPYDHDGNRDLFHCGKLSGRSGPALEVLGERSRVDLAVSRCRVVLEHAHGGGGILALKLVSRLYVSLLYST